MNIRVQSREAERVQSKGDAIYSKLLPKLKQEGCEPGHFVAINIETGRFVTAKTRLELMTLYKQQFGQAAGWVKRIEYDR